MYHDVKAGHRVVDESQCPSTVGLSKEAIMMGEPSVCVATPELKVPVTSVIPQNAPTTDQAQLMTFPTF